MKRIIGLLNNKKGSALLSVMIVMVMLSIVGAGILTATANNVKSARNDKAYKDSYYRGETSVNLAADSLKKGIDQAYNKIVGESGYLSITSAKATSILSSAISYAESSLPAELQDGAVQFEFDAPLYDAMLGGYTVSGTIKYSDSSKAMNRSIGVDVAVKLMPLIESRAVKDLTSGYSALNDAAIISNGSFVYNGKQIYLYEGGIVYLNKDEVNKSDDGDIIDKNGKLIEGAIEVKKGNGYIVPSDMTNVSWLNINVAEAVADNTTTSGSKIYLGSSSTITSSALSTYKGKSVFVNGNLTFNLTDGGGKLNLDGAKFFVRGTTTINLPGNTNEMSDNGFNNCMIFSEGNVSINGKMDNLYEKKATQSASMYVYTNGNLFIDGKNSSDNLSIVAYAKGNIEIDFQPIMRGQLIAEGGVSFLAGTGKNKLDLTYESDKVGGFYNSIENGIGGTIDVDDVTVTYGFPMINTKEAPYVSVSSVREY